METETEVENHPDFAVIWSFFSKFGKQIEMEEIMITDVIKWISSPSNQSSAIDVMVKLMRKTGMRVDKQRWQKHLAKATAMKLDLNLAEELQTGGFQCLSIPKRLKLLKFLCEMQFDDNMKFKAIINNEDAEEQRLKPVGRDENGLVYWHQEDEDLNIRVYIEDEDEDDDSGWKVACRSKEDIANLIKQLTNEPIDGKNADNSDDEEENIVETKFQKFLKTQCTSESNDDKEDVAKITTTEKNDLQDEVFVKTVAEEPDLTKIEEKISQIAENTMQSGKLDSELKNGSAMEIDEKTLQSAKDTEESVEPNSDQKMGSAEKTESGKEYPEKPDDFEKVISNKQSEQVTETDNVIDTTEEATSKKIEKLPPDPESNEATGEKLQNAADKAPDTEISEDKVSDVKKVDVQKTEQISTKGVDSEIPTVSESDCSKVEKLASVLQPVSVIMPVSSESVPEHPSSDMKAKDQILQETGDKTAELPNTDVKQEISEKTDRPVDATNTEMAGSRTDTKQDVESSNATMVELETKITTSLSKADNDETTKVNGTSEEQKNQESAICNGDNAAKHEDDQEKEESNPNKIQEGKTESDQEGDDEEEETEELKKSAPKKKGKRRKGRASGRSKRSKAIARKPRDETQRTPREKKPKLSRLELLKVEAESILHMGEKKSKEGEDAYRTRSGRRVKSAKKDEPEVWQTLGDDVSSKNPKTGGDEGDVDFEYVEKKRKSRTNTPVKEIPKKEIKRIVNDDTPCMKCGLFSHPETILLCDGCDKGHHMACLTPPLMIVPDDEWFCPKCSKGKLIARLKEICDQLDSKQKLHQRKTRKSEYKKLLDEYTGISATNIIPNLVKSEKPKPAPKKRRRSYSSNSDSDDLIDDESYSSAPSSPEIKPTRRCRTKVSYDFSTFDKTIMEAIGDDIHAKPEEHVEKPISGKDIRTIIAAEKGENAEELNEPEDDTIPGKRKKRKLTNLNSSEDEAVESGSNYSVSDSEEVISDEEFLATNHTDSEESLDGGRRRRSARGRKKPLVKPVKRSKRLRRKRIQEDYETSLSESSTDYEDAPKQKKAKKKGKWNGYGRESSEEEYVPPRVVRDPKFIDDDEEEVVEGEVEKRESKRPKRQRIVNSSSDEDGGEEKEKTEKGEEKKEVKEEVEKEEKTAQKDSKVKKEGRESSDDWSSLSSNAAETSEEGSLSESETAKPEVATAQT